MTVRVVGLHLDLSGLWRRRQARAILHHLETQTEALPTILMGDTNEWTRTGGCLRDFTLHHQAADTGPSYHARRPVGSLDKIFVSPDLAVAEAGVHHSPKSRIASDHLPIWAQLKPVRRFRIF
jgi:endonuclease/exonuclease/phosphatase family metal-dependent hydrolase